jgi:hypothetical protein
MIKGVHSMFYSSQADELRAFLRDKLALPFTDVGDGWLIFDAPEAEVGVHPSDDQAHSRAGTHAISFYCDDVHNTVADLKSKGVEFAMEVEDHGYGLVTNFKMPGDVLVQLYQPHYKKTPRKRPAPAAARKKPRQAAKLPMKAVKRKPMKKVATKSKRRGGKR